MYSDRHSIDLTKLPSEPWSRTAYLFGEGAQIVSTVSAEWVESSYAHRDELRSMWQFLHWHFSDGVRGTLDALSRVWYFPWTECEAEMEMAFAYALAGLHRASIDHARRALELALVGAYFVAEHVDKKSGNEWLESRIETPLFSRALKELGKSGFAKQVFETTNWRTMVQEHYWALSDSVHVRGQQFSIRAIQSANGSVSGFPLASFSPELLADRLDSLLCTSEHLLVALTLPNPILLIGVPLSQKYGLHEPLGFFEEEISAELRALLPESLRDQLVSLAEADEQVIGLLEHFESYPDITAEELQRQIDDV